MPEFERFANNFDSFAREAIAHVVEIDQNLKAAESGRNIKQQPDESSIAFRARVANADARLEAAREPNWKQQLVINSRRVLPMLTTTF